MARPKKLVETEVPESIREILDEHLMDPALDFDRDERSIPHFEFVMDQLKTIIVDGRVDVSLKLDAVRLYVEIVHELYGY